MREIKFRGYTYSKQCWLYGNLIEKEDPTRAEPTPWVRLIHDRALTAELVAFDSVGQYTGLKDKNGKDIYEGDILKIANMEFSHFENSGVPDSPNEIFEDIIGQVSFSEGWFVVDGHSAGEMPLNEPNADDIEVIGNIYSNPELLKA